jgi:hypothetical protein
VYPVDNVIPILLSSVTVAVKVAPEVHVPVTVAVPPDATTVEIEELLQATLVRV